MVSSSHGAAAPKWELSPSGFGVPELSPEELPQSRTPTTPLKKPKMYFLTFVWNFILVVDCSVNTFPEYSLGGDSPNVFSMLQFIKFMEFISLSVRHSVNSSFYSMCTFLIES